MWPIRGRTCVYVSKFLIIYLVMISAVISHRLHHRFMKTAESDIFFLVLIIVSTCQIGMLLRCIFIFAEDRSQLSFF